MHSLTIVRRRGLGFGSVKSITQVIQDMNPDPLVREWKTWRESTPPLSDIYLRWGCTSTIPNSANVKVLNNATAIHRVNNKADFASVLSENGVGPNLITWNGTRRALQTDETEWVVRPLTHSRGRNFHVVSGTDLQTFPGQWYARPLIKKSAEYRVYVLFGKVAAVASKARPEDPNQHAWNHALGCEFSNVRWDDWPLQTCHVAMQGARLSGLDYAAVDMMVEEETGRSYVIEINSAGSLPRNSDRTPSYRARCVAKAIGWHLHQENYDHFYLDSRLDGWRDIIHPGVWGNYQ